MARARKKKAYVAVCDGDFELRYELDVKHPNYDTKRKMFTPMFDAIERLVAAGRSGDTINHD